MAQYCTLAYMLVSYSIVQKVHGTVLYTEVVYRGLP